jgi:glutamate-1-semialdehyde aminotransferase
MAVGLATLDLVLQPGFYEQLHATTTQLIEGLREQAETTGVALTTNHIGGMFGLFFGNRAHGRHRAPAPGSDGNPQHKGVVRAIRIGGHGRG